jgi:hypothetical protein
MAWGHNRELDSFYPHRIRIADTEIKVWLLLDFIIVRDLNTKSNERTGVL